MARDPSTPSAFCAVCDAARPVAHRFARNGYSVVACELCGFEFVSPAPSAGELADYYAAGTGGDYANYVRARAMKKQHFRVKLAEVAAFLPSPGRMLDVGCAAGFLLEVARGAGWDVRGVELNPGFAAYTGAEVKDRVVYGRLGDVDVGAGFQLVTLFDVLEHTVNPRQDLARCRDLLAPGGVLIVQLPCIDSLGRRLLGSRWYHYAPPAHLSYFSRASFAKLASSLALDILQAGWTRKLLTLDYFVSQVASGYLGIDTPSLGKLGATRVSFPMSERLFVLRRAFAGPPGVR